MILTRKTRVSPFEAPPGACVGGTGTRVGATFHARQGRSGHDSGRAMKQTPVEEALRELS